MDTSAERPTIMLSPPPKEEARRDAAIARYMRAVAHHGESVLVNIGALTRLLDEVWLAGHDYAARLARDRELRLEGELKRISDALAPLQRKNYEPINECASPAEIRRDGGPYDTAGQAARNPLRPDGDDPPHG